MIVVTGAAGFIGSNLVQALNAQGRRDILLVDHLKNGHKIHNLSDLDFVDYMDRDEFLEHVQWGTEVPDKIDAVFHLGACSDTTEWNGRYLMQNNFTFSKAVLRYCRERRIRLVYASSAAVYGNGRVFAETREHERPINAYGFSKFAFDQYVRAMHRDEYYLAGVRYFNVYGPREAHKGGMASVAWHLHQQLLSGGVVKLFGAYDGYANGEQQRDFIHVADAVAVTLWLGLHGAKSGIYNCGTGRAQSFNAVAEAVLDAHGRGSVEYLPFPDHLKGSYQSYTQADLTQLRAAGYTGQFRNVEQGVTEYIRQLQQTR